MSETNNSESVFSGSADSILPLGKHPKAQEQQVIFWINASSDVSKNDSQPVSQAVSQAAGVESSARGLMSKCLRTLRLMMYDVLKCKM